jgi:hypothetical protein
VNDQRSLSTNQPTQVDLDELKSRMIPGQIEQVVSSADCRSAAFGCGGSIPSLPTSFTSNDGPNGSSFCFQPTDERRLTRVEGS